MKLLNENKSILFIDFYQIIRHPKLLVLIYYDFWTSIPKLSIQLIRLNSLLNTKTTINPNEKFIKGLLIYILYSIKYTIKKSINLLFIKTYLVKIFILTPNCFFFAISL